LRPIFHARCRFHWRQLYGMNHRTDADRARFLDKVGTMLQRL
jgi:NAD(P)H dehydrogenase (quinone)